MLLTLSMLAMGQDIAPTNLPVAPQAAPIAAPSSTPVSVPPAAVAPVVGVPSPETAVRPAEDHQLYERLLGPEQPVAVAALGSPLADAMAANSAMAPAPGSPWKTWWPMGAGVLALAGAWYLRKRLLSGKVLIPGVKVAPEPDMKVLARTALGGQNGLVLVEVNGLEGKLRMVIGTSASGPALLTELGANNNNGFQTVLQAAPPLATPAAAPEPVAPRVSSIPRPLNPIETADMDPNYVPPPRRDPRPRAPAELDLGGKRLSPLRRFEQQEQAQREERKAPPKKRSFVEALVKEMGAPASEADIDGKARAVARRLTKDAHDPVARSRRYAAARTLVDEILATRAAGGSA